MNWQFIDYTTLKECDSGYILHLLSGTWFHPGKIKPEPPAGMEFSKQLKILRAGLQHIKSIGEERNEAKEVV